MFSTLTELGQVDEELSVLVAHLPTQTTRKACCPKSYLIVGTSRQISD